MSYQHILKHKTLFSSTRFHKSLQISGARGCLDSELDLEGRELLNVQKCRFYGWKLQKSADHEFLSCAPWIEKVHIECAHRINWSGISKPSLELLNMAVKMVYTFQMKTFHRAKHYKPSKCWMFFPQFSKPYIYMCIIYIYSHKYCVYIYVCMYW